MDSSNAWVFVSHSNKDFDKIVKVRNKLEALQYKPLLFFLKCLEDDKEIFELIKREIKARDRFILCDSQNSRASEWVQKEIEFIKSLNRPYEIINLEGTEEEIDESIERFNIRSTVYIWSTDEYIKGALSKSFLEKAFKVSLLPMTFFRDYYYYNSGSPDMVHDDFAPLLQQGYLIFIISQALSEDDMYYIKRGFEKTRAFDNATFLIYVIAEDDNEKQELAKANKDLLYDLYHEEGLHARFIIDKDKISCLDRIVKDAMGVDNYHFHLKYNIIPPNYFLVLGETIYNEKEDYYVYSSSLYCRISEIPANGNVTWSTINGEPPALKGQLSINEITHSYIQFEYKWPIAQEGEAGVIQGHVGIRESCYELFDLDALVYAFELKISSDPSI